MFNVTIDFNEFLCTGKICGIDIGSLRADVFKKLGKPEIWSESLTSVYERAIWWVYGKLQIKFCNDNVIVFGFYFINSENFPYNIEVTDLPIKYMSEDEFVKKYEAKNMISSNCLNSNEIILPSGVIVHFNKHRKIISIRKEVLSLKTEPIKL